MKLTELMVKETSGVDHPAHLHEGWLVMKSADLDNALEAVTTTKEIPVELEATEKAVDAVEKAIDLEDIRKELTDLRKALADANAEKVELQKQRELEKAVDTANAWVNLPEMNPAEFAPVLCAIREVMPLEATIIEKVLDASARALNESGLLKEIGTSSTNDVVSAWDTIQAQAQQLVSDGRAPSFAKAVSIVSENNKDLYNQYLIEKGR
ncbi:hypothetical protein UFOVP665_29 [uncultured Caudovirales phage]|uniref:Uncharacterized protein n=1 Tax=uncultured Caudovirales phage TaxID=2100421 RepID=A0A6J5NAS9_9CAUD|nr:hypothetical protein UFOVP665_29 [uncultured Caudovirales phage]